MTSAMPPQFDALLPVRSRRAAALVGFLAGAAARTDGAAAETWHARIDDLYGDLSGQRGLDRDEHVRRFLAAHRGAAPPDLVVALLTYFILICDWIAIGRIGGVPELHAAASAPPAEFLRTLEELAAGRLFHRLGVQPAGNPLPLDWFLGSVTPKQLPLFRDTAADLAALCDALPCLPPALDLPQRIYAGLMPKNLLHVMGEFYTPPWMARLLLDDAGWRPERSLIDPFAGSGVFLLAAIDRAAAEGVSCREVLPRLRAIDRSPAAFAALRANLLVALARDHGGPSDGARLPIACADSILMDGSAGVPPADVLVTNPPWVGWEYIARPYRDRLTPAWKRYGLFTARGRDASFLKEDLSTLALVAAWDRFLKDGGTSAVVLRPAAMRSHLAARGLRRLSLFPDSAPLRLKHVRLFAGPGAFAGTDAPAAAWLVEKGAPTTFPVPVVEWRPAGPRRRPGPSDSPAAARPNVVERELAAERNAPDDSGSPWTVGDPRCHRATRALVGSNPYKVRTGVFTGGANAVYYLRRAGAAGRYRNVVDGAKRRAEVVEWEIEDALVYEVIRGRDLRFWKADVGALLLCPHTSETRLRPLPPGVMEARHPNALAYLREMRPVLEARRGFAGWERAIREETFYAIQRVGEYTFSPFKVGWRYVASDFAAAVVGPGPDGRPRLCNDKVTFLACDSKAEAHFLCGLLSSDPVRWRVLAAATGTQMSASTIKHLNLPIFSASDRLHAEIARLCEAGHQAVRAGNPGPAADALAGVNAAVGRLYGLSGDDLRAVREELRRRTASFL